MPGKKRGAASEADGAADEEHFVRGGGSGLAPIEHRRIKEEAYAEAESDLFASKKKKRRKDQGAAAADGDGDEEDAFFSSLSAQGKLPKYVELLKFKSLSIGAKLWGAVIEVMPRELVVSLPHGLRGHVSYRESSDVLAEYAAEAAAAREQEAEDAAPVSGAKGGKGKSGHSAAAGGQQQRQPPALTELFSVGQLVRCTVVGLRGGEEDKKTTGSGAATPGGSKRKRIDLSLHVTRINAGLVAASLKADAALAACVKSVEDHGYMLTLGIKGASAFLAKKAVHGAEGAAALKAGALVEVVVQEVKAGGGKRVNALVSADPSVVATAATKEWEGLNIETLVPGALVPARVRNVLSDGLILSFLTFFTGTVDPFHVSAAAGAKGGKPADWAKGFGENQRVRARIIYVDSAAKRVGLSVQRHLLDAALPTNFPLMGQVFEAAEVRRVDPGLGLLLDLSTLPGATPLTQGYAHLSNLSDNKVESVEGKFRVGQIVRARVVGFRPMDGLAVMSFKPSVVEQSMLSVADVAPGMRVSGTVAKADETGVVLQLTPTIRAVVPAAHMSDIASNKAHRKFKLGQKVAGRVLQVDAVQKRVTVTLKQTLVDSKLPVIARAEDAAAGTRAHGTVTGVQDYGIFLSFFGGVSGLAAARECGLPEGQRPGDAFSAGQVVKCRVLGVDPGKKGLRLTLLSRKKAAEEEAAAADGMGGLQPGAITAATVAAVHRDSEGAMTHLTMELHPATPAGTAGGAEGSGAIRGRLEVAHLADHPAAAAALAEAAAVGTRLEGLLVLQRLEAAKQLRVTRKASLLAAAATGVLPAALSELSEGLVVPGYVASVTGDAVYVRFLGDLTGRAGLAQLSDTFVSDPGAHFLAGQSVRAAVVQVDREKAKFAVALKHSLCSGGGNAPFLSSLLQDLEVAHSLEAAATADPAALNWAEAFPIGGVVHGEIHGVKEYGVLCDMAAHPDVVGLAAPHQVPPGASTAEGAAMRGVVLDVSKKDGIVDLSLNPALAARAAAAAAGGVAADEKAPKKKKRKGNEGGGAASGAAAAVAVAQGEEVRVAVELAKAEEGYCVVSLPEGRMPLLGFLPTADFNLPPGSSVAPQLQQGDALTATVAALPADGSGGRLLLHMPLGPKAGGRNTGGGQGAEKKEVAGEGGGKAGRKPPLPQRGAIVGGKVEAVHALHADVALDSGHRGRIHITEAADANGSGEPAPNPFAGLTMGDAVQVVMLGCMQSAEGRRHGMLELSTRPSLLSAAAADPPVPPPSLSWGALKPGTQLSGYVQEVAGEHIWAVFSPSIRGRAFLPQAAASVEECAAAGKAFRPGRPVSAVVVAANAGKHALDVAFNGFSRVDELTPGSTALGMITSIGGGGVRVQLGPSVSGRAALTDIHDTAVENALAGLAERQFVRAAVLGSGGGKGGDAQLTLSLRPSRGGSCPAHVAAIAAAGPPPIETLAVGDVKPGQRVSGYVKSSGPSGVFVCLARGLDARVKLRQLADTFVDDPAAAFPAGSRVEGLVVGVDGGRIDLTLRKKQRPPPSLESLEEGQVVRGRVRRVEPFGVFVDVEGCGVSGLAHVSELADDFVKDVGALFTQGQAVVARVTKIDRAAGRLSLGLKPSYFECLSDHEEEGSGGNGGPDFDQELEAAMGAGSGGEEDELPEADADEDDSSYGSKGEEEAEGAAGEGLDLDEELLAGASDGGSSDDGDDE